jgi:hypothetical protein
MKNALLALALAAWCALPLAAAAQEAAALEHPAPVATPAAPPAAAEAEPSRRTVEISAHATLDATDEAAPGDVDTAADEDPDPDYDDDGPREIVSIGHDSRLERGQKAQAVVSIMGSSTSEGEVSDSVVSILGDSHVTGPVGDEVVAVLGNVYLDSRTGGDVVSVLGSVELGPNANVGGEVVTVGGTVVRAGTAVTRGGIQQVMTGSFDGFKWIRPWVKHCLLLGRPLALVPGIGWAWTLAFALLAFYVLLALAFRKPVDTCVKTFETQPGRSLLASLLALLLPPVVIIALAITVIGAVLIPFLAVALFFAALFGKAVMLALIGRIFTRHLGDGPLGHTAVAVLLGGVIVLGLYLIPFFGFILHNLLGLLGLGVVLYTIVLTVKAEQAAKKAPPAAADATMPPAFGVAPAAMASPGATAAAGQPTTLVDPATHARAGFLVRMGALAIDALLIGICVSLVDVFGETWILLLAVYGAAMWKLKGTTIGGIVCGLKVVRLDGREVDWATAIVRALGCFLSLAIAGLGFIWIAFDDEKQGWHDKIAGTVVLRMPKGVSLV